MCSLYGNCFINRLLSTVVDIIFNIAMIKYMKININKTRKYIMNVKSKKANIVHILKTNGYTGCGVNVSDNLYDWELTSSKVTCNKNGCKD